MQVEVTKDVEHFKTGAEDLSAKALKSRLGSLQDLFNAIVKMASEKQENFDNSSKFFAFKAQCSLSSSLAPQLALFFLLAFFSVGIDPPYI